MKSINQIPAKALRNVKGVFTDVDDTLTTAGRLDAHAYTALQALVDKGLRVVPVTGGPAGWCDHMARAWGVDAVVARAAHFIFTIAPTLVNSSGASGTATTRSAAAARCSSPHVTPC